MQEMDQSLAQEVLLQEREYVLGMDLHCQDQIEHTFIDAYIYSAIAGCYQSYRTLSLSLSYSTSASDSVST